METRSPSCPLSKTQATDLYYLEHRAKLIDIASFLDRVDRAGGKGGDDFRLQAFRQALAVLTESEPGRAKRVLELLSDPTAEPIDTAAGMKGASGAYPGAPSGGK